LKQGSTPFAVHPPFGRPGGLNIQGIEARVADHPNAGHASSVFHFNIISIKELKADLKDRGV